MITRLVRLAAALLLLASPALGPALAQDGADVTLETQTIDGRDVVVDEVTLPDGGFIVIHDATLADGNVLGSVVGVSEKLPAGTHEDVTAHLYRHLDEDQKLVAMPHRDTDDDATYSFVSDDGQADVPYTDGDSAVTDAADVTVSATVTGSDQDTDGRHVLVDRVSMEDGGFVAVHDDRLLQGMPVASVVGSSAFLEAGVHTDVRITLDEELAQNQTLVFMPHRDSDDDGEYDFVTTAGQEDPPYTNHTDDAVVDDAEVTISDQATATFDDQSTGGHVVDVEQAFLPDGGFVVIHDSSLVEGATFESVRGASAYLEPGLHGSVEVVLDDPLQDDDSLYAMPHRDTDDDQTYDFVSSDGADDGPYTDEDGAVTDAGEAHVSASVTYHRQDSDSRTIVVERADLSQAGFVTVHDASLQAGAVFDSVVGVSEALEAGLHRNLTVTLSTPVVDSQPLIPMPHKDTDGDGSYGFVDTQGQEDGPFADAQGSPVVDPGFTEVRASVTASDQTTDGGSATIDSATLTQGGFVTVHDASLLEGQPFDSVVGTSAHLDPGTATDVEVPFEGNLTEDQTLYAMPHRDTDGDGEYDFVTSNGADDGPYTAAGQAVVDPFHLTAAEADDGMGGGDGGTGGNGMPSLGLGAVAAVLGLAALAGRRRR